MGVTVLKEKSELKLKNKHGFLKKNLNASGPSEHPPVRGEKMPKVGSWAAKTKPLRGI